MLLRIAIILCLVVGGIDPKLQGNFALGLLTIDRVELAGKAAARDLRFRLMLTRTGFVQVSLNIS